MSSAAERRFFSRTLEKPDGRELWLFARHEMVGLPEVAPVPKGEAAAPNPHLRWHPLRGEWIAYAGHRQNRTFLPPPEWDPLAPTSDPENPTELPPGNWEVAVFQNRFPTLHQHAHDAPKSIVPTLPAQGSCEVVVYGQEARGSLGEMPLSRIELLIDVWAERTRALAERPDVQCVFPFENRGVEVGVTLQHPHGQLYAYPFVPPIMARELEQQRLYFDAHQRGLLEAHLELEIEDGRRILWKEEHALAFVPVCARWAYEIWIAPRRAVPTLVELDPAERAELAKALKTCLLKLDGLFGRPMPYILSFHQAPVDGKAHPECHVHAQIYPYLRMPDRLKYLAGSEIAAGTFTADTFPEDKAQELRRIEVTLE